MSSPKTDFELDPLNSSGRSQVPRSPPKGRFVTFWTLLMTPLNFLLRLPSILTTLIPFLSRLVLHQAIYIERRQLSPKDSAARFIRQFEEQYGHNHVDFLEMSYQDAVRKMRADVVFLIVVIVSTEHDDMAEFYGNVLRDTEFRDWAREYNVLIWAGDVADSEAYQVANQLNVTRYPTTLLFSPLPPSSGPGVTTLVHRHAGPGPVLPRLRTSHDHFLTAVRQKRREREEQDSNRRMREMQDEAFERSLTIDRERLRLEKETKERKIKERNEAERSEREKERLLEIRKQWRIWRAQRFREEGLVGLKPQTGTTARISLRLPTSERQIIVLPGTMRIEDLYAFVDSISCHSMTPITYPTKPPPNYQHQYNFKLVVPMPRHVIESFAENLLKEEEGIWPSGGVVVEMDEGEEENWQV